AHIRPQATYVDENAADFWLRVETLEHDLRQVYRWLGVPTWTELPQRRSRDGRAADYSYDRFFLRSDELTPSLRDRVRQIYASDYELLRRVERRPRWSSSGNVRGPVRSSTGARPAVHPDQVGPEDAARLLDAFAEENARRERVIVLRLGSRGFMAELTFLARAMAYAWLNDLQLILDSADFSYGHADGWPDYFRTFSAPPESIDSSRIVDVLDFHGGNMAPLQRVQRFMPDLLEIGDRSFRSWTSVLAGLTGIAFQPSAACWQRLEPMIAGLALPPNYLALHIRRGDKVDDEDIYYPTPLYLEKAGLLPPDWGVFVMGDDFAVVTEVRRHLEDCGMRNTVHTLCPDTAAGFDVFALRSGRQFMTGGNGAEVADADGSYVRGETDRLLAEMIIAAQARRFVSTARSNVGLGIRFLHRNRDAVRLLDRSEVEPWLAAASSRPRFPAAPSEHARSSWDNPRVALEPGRGRRRTPGGAGIRRA
ncbi:MAG: sulfotransferase family 2 domain-containing protein, partial [Pseudomonadota bacterium]